MGSIYEDHADHSALKKGFGTAVSKAAGSLRSVIGNLTPQNRYIIQLGKIPGNQLLRKIAFRQSSKRMRGFSEKYNHQAR